MKIADMEAGVDVFIYEFGNPKKLILKAKNTIGFNYCHCQNVDDGTLLFTRPQIYCEIIGRINERGEMEEVS